MDFKLSNKAYILIKSFIWVFYLFFLVYFFNGEHYNEIVISVLLCALVIQMTLISFVDNWYRNKRPTLLDWFRLTTFFVLIINFFGIIKNINRQENFNGYILKPEFILLGIITILTGLFALKISEFLYVLQHRKSGGKKNPEVKIIYDLRSPNLFFLFTIALAFIQIYLVLSGQVGYGTFQENTTSDLSFLFQIVFILTNLFLTVLAIFKYQYATKNKYLGIVFWFFFFIQVLYGFLTGMKEAIIVPVVIVLIPYLLAGRKLPKKLIYIGFIALLLVYPLNNNYRDILNGYPNLKKNEAFGLALAKTMELSFSENVNQGSENFSDRLSLFPYLIYAVEKEGEWKQYKHMDRYVYLPVAWILPRFVIPDKPKSENGAILNEMIFGYSTNSLTVTTYGWAFLEGGLVYVFFAFLLFGFFISYFQYNLGVTNFFGLLLYIGILVSLLKVESDIYFIITAVLHQILICFLFYKFMIKKQVLTKTRQVS
ncbi:hypothetical protein [Flavobacterium cerinum]|uniref:Oligosaccharide repeat unit polymerase n=1 Tax=Flavobacterium cerinum TaxID=2502784 RepID=A0ABY5IW32_9FLAO|nr:hypothetical protein [Flavobacterium cerinum]UUC47020.1 hypothetical protein NOX80_07405 [Flavobacterium cerinum]